MLLSNVAYASEANNALVTFNSIDFGLGPFVISTELVTMWAIMLIITVVCYLGTRNMQREPKGLQNALEMGTEMLLGFLSGLMGKKRARMYLPFLMTFFILILVSNYSGLLPMAGHAWVEDGTAFYKPPTSNVNVTGALAFVVFLAVIYYGVKAKGASYFKHFLEPMFFLLPINILEQFTRPLSLALRLYGNIYGEEMVVAALAALMPFLLPLPIQVLGVLFGAVQAFVFTLLAAMYLEEATAVHEHE